MNSQRHAMEQVWGEYFGAGASQFDKALDNIVTGPCHIYERLGDPDGMIKVVAEPGFDRIVDMGQFRSCARVVSRMRWRLSDSHPVRAGLRYLASAHSEHRAYAISGRRNYDHGQRANIQSRCIKISRKRGFKAVGSARAPQPGRIVTICGFADSHQPDDEIRGDAHVDAAIGAYIQAGSQSYADIRCDKLKS